MTGNSHSSPDKKQGYRRLFIDGRDLILISPSRRNTMFFNKNTFLNSLSYGTFVKKQTRKPMAVFTTRHNKAKANRKQLVAGILA